MEKINNKKNQVVTFKNRYYFDLIRILFFEIIISFP